MNVQPNEQPGEQASESPFVGDNPKLEAFIRGCQEDGLSQIDQSTVLIWLAEILENNQFSFSAGNVDGPHSLLIRHVHFDFSTKLIGLIKQEYLNGEDDEVLIFTSLCCQVGYKPVPKATLEGWFKRFRESADGIHPEYQQLIRLIFEVRVFLKRSFYVDRDCRWRVRFMDASSRYSFCLNNWRNKLNLSIADRYHDEQGATLYPTVPPDKKFQTFWLDTFSHFVQNYGNYWLILNDSSGTWINRVYLLKVSFVERELRVVLQETANDGRVDGIIFDETDKHKFAINIQNNGIDGHFMVLGCVAEDMSTLRVDRQNQLSVEDWKYPRLCDDKIFGIYGEVPGLLIYYSINVNSKVRVKEFELNFNWPEHAKKRTMWRNYAWLKRQCYFQVERESCYVLDVETLKCSKLDFLSLGFPYGIYPSDDDCLVLVSDNTLCVQPLRRPLKLETIAYFSIRRYATLLESGVYAKAMQKMALTSEFQPFFDFL